MKQAGPFFWVKGFIMMALAANVNAQHNPFKAPLYWSVYEDQIVKEKAGLHDVHITEEEWLANIDWVDANLKDLGYTMICIDGWGDLAHLNDNGYRLTHSRHWKHDYAWWSAHLRARGMKLGMYGNPLWVHVADDDTERLIVGTDIPVSTLKDPDERAHFPWVHVDRPGAEEYIKGWIHFYADMGVDYYRIDFLSWFEDGWDRWMGRTGPKRPREHYITALRWMREAADERGMFLSLVMPHLYEEAAAELQYGHMIRINEDTLEGGWFRWSENKRGEKREGWSVYANAADGLTYWSHIAGRGRMILDADFIRLNTFANDDEKRSVISLSLMAGGAVTVSDQHHTIGTDLWLYANRELLELNYDGFVGQPLTNDPTRVESQIWTGQMSNGDWIIGLFNRESEPQTRSITFASLGIEGEAAVRDLWAHENLGTMPAFREVIPPRGCRILRVVPADAGDRVPSIPTAMKVDAIQVGKVTGEDGHTRGAARIQVTDTDGTPVEGATVRLQLSGSFDETLRGVTDADGWVQVTTEGTAPGDVRLRVVVSHVQHPELIYAGGLSRQTIEGSVRYVAGTYNNWQLQPMTFAHGAWRLTAVPMSRGDHRLKFADTPNFSGDDWGNAQGLSGTVRPTTGGDPDVRFTIERGGLFDVALDDKRMRYQITRSHVKTLFDQLYVAGTYNDWQPVPMRFEGEYWALRNVALDAGEYQLKSSYLLWSNK